MIKRVLVLSALSVLTFVACSSENISSSPKENDKITCDVIVDTDSALVFKIVIPDSGSVLHDFSLTKNKFLWKTIAEFEKDIPQSLLDQVCINSNAEAEELREELKDRSIDAIVTTECKENIVERTITVESLFRQNPMPRLAAPMVYNCD